MFSRKKKKAQAPPPSDALPPTSTPPLNNATLLKGKKTSKKDKKKKKESFTSDGSPSVTPKKRGFRFGKKSKAPASPYNDSSSVANDSVGDSSSLYQSGDNADLNTTRHSNATSYSSSLNQSSRHGDLRSPSFGSPMSPSDSVTTGSASGSYQEEQNHTSRGYEERDLEFWDEADVLQWLGDQGLDYFVELFDGCEIDGEYLLDVTEDDLIELEVDEPSLRKSLLNAVQGVRQKQAHSNVPTLDQQLSALGQTTDRLGGKTAKKLNDLSKATTVATSDVKDSPRNLSPQPKLVLKKPPPASDSESDFDFDSDDLGNPLDDLLDNSGKKRVSDDDEESSPRGPVEKSGAPRGSGKKAGISESVVAKTDSQRSKDQIDGAPPDNPSAASDSPHSQGKPPNESSTPAGTTDASEMPASPTRTVFPKSRSNNVHSPRRRSESIVTTWSQKDVLVWLQEAQLTHLKNHFIEHRVTGTQLFNIDMQLLDSMGITSDDDRELLLAKLYELSNPAANVPEKDLISTLSNTSGYEHRKYMAAMKVLQSSDSEEVQILPPETLAVPDSFSSSSRTPSTASDAGKGEEKKKKGGLSKLKGVISPKRRESRDYNLVQVWTDILRSGDTTVSMRLTETENVQDLIKLCLDQLDTVEDWRLYCILDAAGSLTDHKDKGFERVMEDGECPVVVQQDWPERQPRHFELRQRPAQGGSVKVVLRLDDEKPKGKLLAISLSTPAKEVVPLGLKKFGLTYSDPKKYCLLEVDKAGDLHDVDDDSLPLQSDSHAFVLCEAASKDSQLALYDDREETEDKVKVQRNDSQTSKASSKVSFSGVSLGSSAGSDDLLAWLRIDNKKLSKLEEEMATIEESLGPAKGSSKGANRTSTQDTSSSKPPTSPQPADERAEKNAKEKDVIIAKLHQENKTLQEKAKQLPVVQKALIQLQQTYKQNETDSKQRLKEKRESLTTGSGESLPKAITDIQGRLHHIGEEINNKKLNILKIQQQQKQFQARGLNSIQQAELEYRVALEESSMLTLHQQQAQLLAQLELSLADHQANMEKRKASEQSQPLFSSLQAGQDYSLYTLHQSRGKQSWDFTLGANQNGRGAVVQRCSEDSQMRVGDRVLELNRENVTNSPIAEILQSLGSKSQARLVLMRESDDADRGPDLEEMERLHEHLEAVEGDNNRQMEEINRLKGFESQARQATQLQVMVQKLQSQLSDSEKRAEKLEEQLVAKDKEQILRQLQDDKHQLQMEVIRLNENVCQLENALDEKTSELSQVCQERDSVIEELLNKADENKTSSSHHLINEALEEGLPLWEALKSASKPEILEVLREELEEAGRQKEYLDQLYTLMLERAPSLLADLEENFDASELSDNEEFC
ncbi:uncharacterized protein LOC110980634 isoform X2 [Acanthaster planci]|uniref:Uncharacterized protein LOC110980634 isoform X2 n=1 Tax=Acanthaster planci TaxID=133434 RepID=A0A8B7YKP1_ACAPL|nr:uncharacterized protein LOC110980634 isoform X2 [Acanthaster planci]